MITVTNRTFFCRLPRGSAFMICTEIYSQDSVTYLKFKVTREDGSSSFKTMSEKEWNEFCEKYIVVLLEEESNEPDNDLSSRIRKNDRGV
jgi:hypothetical protein